MHSVLNLFRQRIMTTQTQISGETNITITKRRRRERGRAPGRGLTGTSMGSNNGPTITKRLSEVFWMRSRTTSTATLLPLSGRNVSRPACWRCGGTRRTR